MTTSTLYENSSGRSYQAYPFEWGVQFSSTVAGNVTAIRFYRSVNETGLHTVKLWSTAGTLLASATSTSESASGWQQVSLSSPYAITAGATYIASFGSNSGQERLSNGFSTSKTNSTGQLTIPAIGGRLTGNKGTFPDGTTSDDWGVSLVFDDGGSLASGIASLISTGSTIATVSCGSASGGTAPITSQVYRSTTSGFTPGSGNIVSGATSLTLNDTGLTNGTTYYYKFVFTDSLGATATSNQVAATPNTSSLVTGTASLASRGGRTANLTTTAPTLGTSPYTYQWKTSTDNVTFTSIAGATTANYAYAPSSDSLYYLCCNYGDAASGSATSNVISVVLSTEQVFFGAIGNSITAGTIAGSPPPPTTTNTVLETLYGYRQCTFSNQAVSGTTTANWVQGQTNYINAVNAFNSASSGISKKYVLIMLGANDNAPGGGSLSKANYKANLLNTCSGLISSGYKVILNYPIWANSSGHSNTLTLQYQEAINELINGATILQGDIFGYQYFFQNQSQLSDGLHPNQIGANNLGTLWAYGLWRAVYSIKVAVRRSLKL